MRASECDGLPRRAGHPGVTRSTRRAVIPCHLRSGSDVALGYTRGNVESPAMALDAVFTLL